MSHKPMRILFVCLGNICRSPSAEAICRTVIADIETDSAGTSSWHIGDPPYGPMIAAAEQRGIKMSDLRARQFVAQDFDRFDLIIGMDESNMRNIEALRPIGNHTPVRLMTDFVETPESEVPDPYYTRDFEGALDLLERCASGLAQFLNQTPHAH